MKKWIATLLLLDMSAPALAGPESWPLFKRYAEHFISEDGRVIDRKAGERSTSEAQAYALFFALVANDRPLFSRLLNWTQDNLAKGDLKKNLPAWLWGKDRQGVWRPLDSNAASDADLWLGYVLLEAARLWSEPSYARLGQAILSQVALHEVANLPGLGPTLLPGPVGFELEKGTAWRLNPSYVPTFLLRRIEKASVPGPWRELIGSAERTIRSSARKGFVPDWVLYTKDDGFDHDPMTGPIGSYDAIRVYLWIGLMPQADPLRSRLAQAANGMLNRFLEHGSVPEQVNLRAGKWTGAAPPGFVAALLPEAYARGDHKTLDQLTRILERSRSRGLYGDPPAYYDQNLIMFALGYLEGRFYFTLNGSLKTRWEESCATR